MESVWHSTAKKPCFESLKNDIKVDVLIIGGGIMGILCAHALGSAGVNYALVEAGEICGGITKNTTAKVTFQHGLIYDKLIRTFGKESALMYLEANMRALDKYRELCQDIDCDFEARDSFVYSTDDMQRLEKEAETLNSLGIPAELVSKPSIPLSVVGAVKVTGQAQFHPLKFLYAIAKDLKIFENTKVLELTADGAITNCGKIRARKIIVATHFPFINKHGFYFVKMYQHRSYVLALENASQPNGIYVDEAEKGLSFRNHGNLLLLGGGSHRTGKKGGGWQELEAFARLNYPKSRVIYRFATQDCMTLDGIPYVGRYSPRTENLYVATGFNKWGMTSAMAAADILCGEIIGKKSQYAEVFSTSRSILRPQLSINAVETLTNLLTPTAPRCPHLGCALKYNKQEHSWDCPCHGSRFTENGKLIDNPATDDKKM